MKEKIATIWLYYFVGSVAFLIPAFYNGFPLLYADLGTYIRSGFMPEIPIDRPITYGLLIRLFSLNGLFIWGVTIMQALSLLWSMRIFSKAFFPEIKIWQQLILIVPLVLLSAVSWRVSELMPDILSAICFLLLIVLLFRNEMLTKKERIGALILYFIFNSVHFAHLSLHLLVLFFALLVWVAGKKIFSFSFFNWIVLFISTFNLFLIGGSAIDKSRHIMQLSALAENGVLYDFLQDNCGKENYSLCKYKDELKKITGADFVYAGYGPVVKAGSWSDLKPEYSHIISKIFTTPKYLKIFVANSMRQTLRQFRSFNIGDGNISYDEGSSPYDAMKEYMPSQLKIYRNSLQYEIRLQNIFPFWQHLHTLVFWISSVILLTFTFITPLRKQLPLILSFLFFMLLANAWTVTTFSCVSDRFQSKYTWMITWIVLLVIAQQIKFRNRKKTTP